MGFVYYLYRDPRAAALNTQSFFAKEVRECTHGRVSCESARERVNSSEPSCLPHHPPPQPLPLAFLSCSRTAALCSLLRSNPKELQVLGLCKADCSSAQQHSLFRAFSHWGWATRRGLIRLERNQRNPVLLPQHSTHWLHTS